MNLSDSLFNDKLLSYQQEITDKITRAFSPFSPLDVPFILASLPIIEKQLRESFPLEAVVADSLRQMFGAISVVRQEHGGSGA